ncbi:MAG TPA: hypothetical protein VHB45_08110 [Alloacidobacterium sp.]|nr:hypothetical protein [Alloacidobacterium sp.]
MQKSRPPVAVWVIAGLYIAVGCAGFVYHFHQFRDPDGIWIAITELLAILAGSFLLVGRNWARWLALAWMAFHVVLSGFHAMREFAVHSVIFALIAWLLFSRPVSRYFRRGSEPAA